MHGFRDRGSANEPTIATLLSHKAHSITSRYVHSADAVLLAAADAVANAAMNLMKRGDHGSIKSSQQIALASDRSCGFDDARIDHEPTR
jgi:hypothetical protein